MKRITVFKLYNACLVALMALSIATAAYADTPPKEVRQAAEEGLPRFLSLISQEDLEDFGFHSVGELQAATLGEPYKVYTLTPQSLGSYEKGSKLSLMISETNSWYFPVMVEGEARTILTVSFLEGRWQAGDIGGLALPQNLQMLGSQMPTLLEEKGVSGAYSTKFVRIFQGYLDFVVVDSSRGEFVIPLLADPSWLDVQNNKLYTPEEIMPKVAELVQRAIQSERKMGGGAVASAPEVDDGKTAIYMLAFGGVVLVGLTIGLLKARKVF